MINVLRPLPLGASVLGLGAIVASSMTAGWWSDLFLNGGTSLLLVVPIWFVSSRLDRDIARVETATQSAIATVRAEATSGREMLETDMASLREAFASLQAERAGLSRQLLLNITEEPTQASLYQTIKHFVDNNTISQEGFRVRLGYPDLWATLRPADGSKSVVIQVSQKYSPRPLFELEWEEGQPAIAMFRALIDEAEKLGVYSATGLDPEAFFQTLREALSVVVETRERRAGDDPGPARQYCAPQWILYDDGIGTSASENAYFMDYYRMKEVNWRQHAGEKMWVDYASLDEALRLAESLGYGSAYVSPGRKARD